MKATTGRDGEDCTCCTCSSSSSSSLLPTLMISYKTKGRGRRDTVTNMRTTSRHRCCKRPRSSMGQASLRGKGRAAEEAVKTTITTTEALSSTSMPVAVALEAGLTGIDTSRRRILDKMSSPPPPPPSCIKSLPSLGRSTMSRPRRRSSSQSRNSAITMIARPSRWLQLSMILYSLFCVAVTFVECSNDGTTNNDNRNDDSNNQHRDAVDASEFFHPTLPQPRMIGGSSASGKYSEYFVSWGSCAATLIYPDVALTAAHCSMKDSASVGGPNGQTTSIVSKTNHPNKKLDLAVLQLGGWFGDISTVTLNKSDSNPSSSTLTLVGMGNGGRDLLQGNVEFVAPNVCDELWSKEGFSIDADSMICAGSFTTSTPSSGGGDDDDDGDDDDSSGGEGQDSVRACPGDSGSPLLDSSGVQVGVVSSGPKSCESSSLPVVYARVSAGFDWIAGNICSESKFPPWWCKGSSSNGKGTTVRVDIFYDGNPEDIEWSIEDGITGRKVAESEFERIDSSQISTFVELPDSAYFWVLKDSFGDGFKGRYQVVEVDRDGEDRSTIVSGDVKLVEDIVEVRFVIGSGFEEFLNPATIETNETPTSGERPDSDTGASDDDETLEPTSSPTEEVTDDDDETLEPTSSPTEEVVEDDDETFEETEAPTEVPAEDDDDTSAEDDDNNRRFLRHRRLDEDDGDDDDDGGDADKTQRPTISPAPSVSMFPSSAPTGKPVEDTKTPSMSPTDIVTPSPSIETSSPTSAPTQGTPSPTSGPSEDTPSPSIETSPPTSAPTQGTPSPTSGPSEEDTPSPSLATSSPTVVPSQETSRPTPSVSSSEPSEETPTPTVSLTLSSSPTPSPSESTASPTDETPTLLPTDESLSPSPAEEETASPSGVATTVPPDSTEPTTSPTTTPAPSSSATATSVPTGSLTEFPTTMPSETNTTASLSPTVLESDRPSSSPTVFSTNSFPPTTSLSPSATPTEEPTTKSPTEEPTTESPSAVPSTSPTELFVTFLLGVNLEITADPATSISWRIRDEESGQQVIGYREGWYTSTGPQFVGPVLLRNGLYEFELERSDLDAGATIDFFEVDILTGGTEPIDLLILDDQDDATVATVSFELTL